MEGDFKEAIELYPRIFEYVDSEASFHQTLLDYAQSKGHIIRPSDKSGKEILSLDELEEDEQAYLYFVDRNNSENNFSMPVSREPIEGYNVFDTRKYVDEKGETIRERHIGNKVMGIEY